MLRGGCQLRTNPGRMLLWPTLSSQVRFLRRLPLAAACYPPLILGLGILPARASVLPDSSAGVSGGSGDCA